MCILFSSVFPVFIAYFAIANFIFYFRSLFRMVINHFTICCFVLQDVPSFVSAFISLKHLVGIDFRFPFHDHFPILGRRSMFEFAVYL